MSKPKFRLAQLLCYRELGAAYLVVGVHPGDICRYDLVSPAGAMIGVEETDLREAAGDQRHQRKNEDEPEPWLTR